ALLALLLAVRGGEFDSGDPLRVTGRRLAEAAQAARREPFEQGLAPEALIRLGLRPDDARRAGLGKLAAADRIAAVLAFALDLEPADRAGVIARPRPEAASAVLRALATIPHELPAEAFRDVLDAHAATTRLPGDV